MGDLGDDLAARGLVERVTGPYRVVELQEIACRRVDGSVAL